jgi:hypothetical protein
MNPLIGAPPGLDDPSELAGLTPRVKLQTQISTLMLLAALSPKLKILA